MEIDRKKEYIYLDLNPHRSWIISKTKENNKYEIQSEGKVWQSNEKYLVEKEEAKEIFQGMVEMAISKMF